MIKAARDRLAARYATGVAEVLWEEHRHPLNDLDAVRAVIDDRGGRDALDYGAALLVMQAARADLDRLEAKLLDAAHAADMSWEQIAAIQGLDDASAAEKRYERLRQRLDEPVAEVKRPGAEPPR